MKIAKAEIQTSIIAKTVNSKPFCFDGLAFQITNQ